MTTLWGKRDDCIVHTWSPFNVESPVSALAEAAITPVDAFYARNHGVAPDISFAQWRLSVDGEVDRSLDLGFDELTTRFAHHSVVATLMCAGNRRAELLQARPIPGKEPWSHGAVSTAEWVGVRLADILEAAGVRRDHDLHVAFAAPDVAPEAVPVQCYGSSVPLGKALSSEVLLAWQMNGQPLPRVHGGPVRVIVPGYIGARSVKWVTAVTVQRGPSQNYFQALDYRLLPADADPDTATAGEGISLAELTLNCDVLVPQGGTNVPAGALTVSGYAITGDRRTVAHVEVSLDGGRNWLKATLEPPLGRWAWQRWSLPVQTRPGPVSLTARAWNDIGETQPESPASLWNPRGYANNAWARVDVTVI